MQYIYIYIYIIFFLLQLGHLKMFFCNPISCTLSTRLWDMLHQLLQLDPKETVLPLPIPPRNSSTFITYELFYIYFFDFFFLPYMILEIWVDHQTKALTQENDQLTTTFFDHVLGVFHRTVLIPKQCTSSPNICHFF